MSFQMAWLFSLGGLLILLLLIGVWIAGRPLGILIDDRNKMSLSRLQLALWTWILVSAFFTVMFYYLTTNITLAPEIWALMGISIGSAAGSVIVKGTKGNQEPAAALQAQAAGRMGLLAINQGPAEAALSDLFVGEELTDHRYVDITKVQMFFFTLATVVGYVFALWNHNFAPDGGVSSFPQISTSLVTLLGISHTGYLTVKAAPKTPT